jgi:hypothetical protein
MKFVVLSSLFTIALSVTVIAADAKPEKPAGETKKSATAPATTQAASTQAVNKYCAVIGPDDLVDPKYNLIYKDQVIGFCCEECRDTFKKKPEKYVKKMK